MKPYQELTKAQLTQEKARIQEQYLKGAARRGVAVLDGLQVFFQAFKHESLPPKKKASAAGRQQRRVYAVPL